LIKECRRWIAYDLDGSKEGCSVNADLIIKIKQQTGVKIQTGGGLRTKQQVNDILQKGIDRVILGSVAVLQPQEVIKWINEL
jgi:phosphoribosylformimino-5-aminoimidazole carboxamide ribotide isomerase